MKFRYRTGGLCGFNTFKNLQHPSYTQIARDELPGCVLRTDWYGFDLRSPSDPQLTIETALYINGMDTHVASLAWSPTEEEALNQHIAWLATLTNGVEPDELRDVLRVLVTSYASDDPPF